MTNNTDGAALLPCPFCGGEGLPHRVPTGWRVSCKNCDAQPRPGFPSDTEADAIAAWNTRAPLPATQEDAERSGVGEPVAYLHTLHMEGGQTCERLTMFNDIDEDDSRVTAFGIPGRDYSEEYQVSTTPLYALSTPAMSDLRRDDGAVTIPADHPLAKSLRTSKKALDEIARQEQANIAGYLALRDFPVGSASAQGMSDRQEYDGEAVREALEKPWSWPCPAGDEHCCCDCEECCDCERPRVVKPDWLNADTCIENVMEALTSDTLFSEDGPVDTMVSSGDLMVILSLAGAAFHTYAALAHPAQARDEMRTDWVYDIQWGPEGQQDYAHVYDRGSNLVAVMKTHHAAMVANHRGALSSDKGDGDANV